MGILHAWFGAQYGLIVKKFIIHVVMLFFVLRQVMNFSSEHSDMMHSMQRDLVDIFYPPHYQDSNGNALDFPESQFNIFTLDQMNDTLQFVFDQYIDVNAISVANIEPFPVSKDMSQKPPSSKIAAPRVVMDILPVSFLSDPGQTTEKQSAEEQYEIQSEEYFRKVLNFHDSKEFKSMVRRLVGLSLNFQVYGYVPKHRTIRTTIDGKENALDASSSSSSVGGDQHIDDDMNCFIWDLKFHFGFGYRHTILFSSQFDMSGRCDSSPDNVHEMVILECLILIFLSIGFYYVSARVMSFERKVLRQMARAAKHHRKGWTNHDDASGYMAKGNQLSDHNSIRLIYFWFACNCWSSFCVCAFAVLQLLYGASGELATSWWLYFCLASSVFMVVFCFSQYLQFFHKMYCMFITIKIAAPLLVKFFIAAVPLIMGYVFFGMVIFGSYSFRFYSIFDTLIVLFAVVYGDVIRETYVDLTHQHNGTFLGIVGNIYLTSFVIIFMYFVLNTCFSILEEAMCEARYANVENNVSTPDGDSVYSGLLVDDGEVEIGRFHSWAGPDVKSRNENQYLPPKFSAAPQPLSTATMSGSGNGIKHRGSSSLHERHIFEDVQSTQGMSQKHGSGVIKATESLTSESEEEEHKTAGYV
eukprot:TRINITY_DN5682_c0_g1_i3.p1 TRINITY_DN5682_c0_g1~~TRINITY_DN5682_c0_g1_i3.p1  ORF type:complete len:640 (-),score=127.17 TRINITY_DN5682_c0_g1_i3:109-2028(-)